MTEQVESTEIARVPVNVGMPLQGLDEAYRLSKNLALASLLPRDLRGKPSDVLALILYGQEIGLAPMQAVQGIYVVEGRPSLSAQTWLALARRAGHKASVKEHTAEKCVVFLERGDTGETHVSEFTIDDAINAGLARRGEDGKILARSQQGKPLPWELHTKSMLLARAVSAGCRFLMPELAMGFYTEDEAREAALHDVEVVTPPERLSPDGDVLDGEVVDEAALAHEVASIAEDFDRPVMDMLDNDEPGEPWDGT